MSYQWACLHGGGGASSPDPSPSKAWGRALSWASAVAPSPCVTRVGVRGALDVFGVGSGVWQEGATSSDARRWPP